MKKSVRELKQKIAREIAQKIRKQHHEEFLSVIAKNKIETYNDVIAIFYGLSKKAKDRAVFDRIFFLAQCGDTPTEIIKTMEPKK